MVYFKAPSRGNVTSLLVDVQRLPQQGATPAADPSALRKRRGRIWRRECKHRLVMLAGGSAA